MKDFLSNDLSFQDRIMQLIEISSPWSWYIYLKNINTSFWLFLQTYICQNRQYQFFMSKILNSNLKQQCKKVKGFLIGWPYVQYFRFQIYGHHLTTPFSSFSIYKKVQLCTYNRWMKPNISFACKNSPFFPPVKTVLV